MGRINLSATMDAIATEITTANLAPRAFGYPAQSVTVPAAVVGYPTELDFDMTFNNGSDRAVFPIYFLMGSGTDSQTRDKLSTIIASATGIKATLDGTINNTVQTARVTECRIEEVTVGGIAYLSATFDLEVYS